MKRFVCNFGLAIAMASSCAMFATADESAPSKASAKSTAKKDKLAASSKGKVNPKTVEMFAAMDEGLITVDYIGKDSTQANIIFRNKASEPLDVILPETFGAVPVLRQMMGGGMGGGGMGGMGGGMGGMGGGMGGMGGGMGGMGGGQGMGGGMGGMGGGQGMGGPMGGMGGGMGGMGGGMGGMGGGMGGMGGGGMMGGGMMRVEPDRPRKFTVATLCLEHGKPDPNPRMKYRIVRLSEVNPNPEIAELCKAVSTGKVQQNTAQAAAWHIANGLSWQELAHKPRMISEYTGIEYYFNPVEIRNALRVASLVRLAAEENSASTSSGDSIPSSGETALLESPGETNGRE